MSDETEFVKDIFDLEFKAVGYLIAAHGAGLVGSLSLLKDYDNTPLLKGIGFFIACFGIGLLFAVLAFIAAQVHRAKVINMMLDGPSGKVNVMLAQAPQLLSGLALIVAICAVIFRFSGL
jgi:hypothetical protein